MEEKLFELNEYLICEKYKLRKKLLKKINYSKFSEALLREEIKLFDKVLIQNYDKEFDELLTKYEKICSLMSSIDKLKI